MGASLPNWRAVLDEIGRDNQRRQRNPPLDRVRRKYLKKLFNLTGRNIIAYYSGWLHKPANTPFDLMGITDNDKNGLMAAVHQLDRSRGLDLILHTPGGDLAAVESIVDYLRKMFLTDIRAIVPQIAMSGGTMIACACKEVVMGKHSNLGPIDPQFSGIPANGVLKEFRQAMQEVTMDPSTAEVWRFIISQYHPTFVGECQRAVDWSRRMVAQWLESGMLKGQSDAKQTARRITTTLFKWGDRTSHSRHIHAEVCEKIGMKVVKLEEDQVLQDHVLTVHHAYIHTLASSSAVKIIENHMGSAMIQHLKKVEA